MANPGGVPRQLGPGPSHRRRPPPRARPGPRPPARPLRHRHTSRAPSCPARGGPPPHHPPAAPGRPAPRKLTGTDHRPAPARGASVICKAPAGPGGNPECPGTGSGHADATSQERGPHQTASAEAGPDSAPAAGRSVRRGMHASDRVIQRVITRSPASSAGVQGKSERRRRCHVHDPRRVGRWATYPPRQGPPGAAARPARRRAQPRRLRSAGQRHSGGASSAAQPTG